MVIMQHNVVSSAATQVVASATTAQNVCIKNCGPDYKVMLLTASNQNISQGFPLCKHEALTIQLAASNAVFARLPAQAGGNSGNVVSQVAVFVTP